MMNEELKKKAEELEDSLQAQLNLVKSDSQDWLKIGTGILAGGLITIGVMRLIKSKKDNKNKKIMSVLKKEGLLDEDVVAKLNANKQPSFVAKMAGALLPLIISYGKDKLVIGHFSSQEEQKDGE